VDGAEEKRGGHLCFIRLPAITSCWKKELASWKGTSRGVRKGKKSYREKRILRAALNRNLTLHALLGDSSQQHLYENIS